MRRFLTILLGSTAMVAAFAAAYLGLLRLEGNFHTVIAGELYRSAQPTPARLADYAHDFGIRSVINLRGSAPEKAWYQDELAATQALGIVHADFGMAADRMLSVDEFGSLVALLRAAPKPLLIHCQAGADRSGLAAAIYLAAISGSDEQAAEKQLSFRYGHIALPFVSRAFATDESWERLEPLLGFRRS